MFWEILLPSGSYFNQDETFQTNVIIWFSDSNPQRKKLNVIILWNHVRKSALILPDINKKFPTRYLLIRENKVIK